MIRIKSEIIRKNYNSNEESVDEKLVKSVEVGLGSGDGLWKLNGKCFLITDTVFGHNWKFLSILLNFYWIQIFVEKLYWNPFNDKFVNNWIAFIKIIIKTIFIKTFNFL